MKLFTIMKQSNVHLNKTVICGVYNLKRMKFSILTKVVESFSPHIVVKDEVEVS